MGRVSEAIRKSDYGERNVRDLENKVFTIVST